MLNIIILAAGRGTRMKSKLPKVLHTLGGRAMIDHVIEKAAKLNPSNIYIVIGHHSEDVREHILANFKNLAISFVLQEQQLGTAHAVSLCLPTMANNDNKAKRVLILYGDVPLVHLPLLEEVVNKSDDIVISAVVDNPSGYGRIIRKAATSEYSLQKLVEEIVEDRHTTVAQAQICEINTGVLCVNYIKTLPLVEKIQPSASGETYLTDIVGLSSRENRPFCVIQHINSYQFSGVNDHFQLSILERHYQLDEAKKLLLQGVQIMDINRIDIRGTVIVGKNVFIDVGVILIGNVQLGDNVHIEAYSILENVKINNGSKILAYSHLLDCVTGHNVVIGPFARIRPGVILDDHTRIGNFVEVKNSNIGIGSKVSHLSYIGDADIGARVNIGAGTITCNYDGAKKHRTTIEDDVFIGSNSQLVAPVTVEQGATIAAGTTLTKTAPANQLTFTKKLQQSFAGWSRPKK